METRFAVGFRDGATTLAEALRQEKHKHAHARLDANHRRPPPPIHTTQLLNLARQQGVPERSATGLPADSRPD